MVTTLKVLATTFIVASAIVLFAFDHLGKLFGVLLIIGSLLNLFADLRERRADSRLRSGGV